MKDPISIRNNIINILKMKGPSLPTYIAKDVGMDSLFTSAFLSELVSEKKIFVSNMKVGNSPIYFLRENYEQLEKFGDYLKSREKDAFLLLKERKILEDEKQEPAIRVALRAIKDFAIPMKKDEKIIWRYFKVNEEELKEREKEKEIPIKKEEKIIEKKEKPIIQEKEKKTKRAVKKKSPEKKDNGFFNRIKEFLKESSIEIDNVEGISKNELFLIIKEAGSKKLLAAYNKSKITEKDFLKANKISKELNLPYILISKGEPSKKIRDFIESLKSMEKIKKLE